jgi:MoaA/NifB/PqqE/SkfB family radical SAM enzyme
MDWLRLLAAYANLRRRKGLLGPGVFLRGAGFAFRRLFSGQNGRAPLIATVSVTSRCPLDCYHCSEGYQDDQELPTDVLRGVLGEISDLGCPVIALTGGEPLLRRDLGRLMDAVPGSVTLLIYTSGKGLTETLASDWKRRANLLVCFSLDHKDQGEHDRRRGTAGSHEAVLRGIERLRGGRAEIHVSSLVTRDRLADGGMVEFARWLKPMGVKCLQLFGPRPVGRLHAKREALLRPDEEWELGRLVRELNAESHAPLVVPYPVLEGPGLLGCCGGYARVHVDSRGHVCPCDFAPLSFGEVTQRTFSDIWSEMRAFFSRPGSKCLVRDFPEIFDSERQERNVAFSSLENPACLRSPLPGFFCRYGELAYRTLVSSLTLSSAAVGVWEDSARKKSHHRHSTRW